MHSPGHHISAPGGRPQCIILMAPLQAFEIARRLEEHPRIARVHYPGLPSHPDHAIAVQQMHGFGGVISFEVGCPGGCAPVLS